MKRKSSFHPYALTAVLCWSLAYVLTRLSLQHFSAFSIGSLRYLVASVTLLIIIFPAKIKCPRKADLPWFFLSGALGFFLYMIAYNQGQKSVSAATGSVVIATVPVFTALLARFVYREKLNAFQWAAIVIEFAGVAVLTLMNGVFSVNVGLFWLLGAALCTSVYNLVQRRLTMRYSGLQSSAFSILFGALLLSIFLPSSLKEAASAPPILLFYVAVMGIFSSAVAYIAWSLALSKAKQTSQVSNYMFITPLLTSILGFLIAGEIPDRPTLIGGSIILFGIVVFHFGGKIYGALPRQQRTTAQK